MLDVTDENSRICMELDPESDSGPDPIPEPIIRDADQGIRIRTKVSRTCILVFVML